MIDSNRLKMKQKNQLRGQTTSSGPVPHNSSAFLPFVPSPYKLRSNPSQRSTSRSSPRNPSPTRRCITWHRRDPSGEDNHSLASSTSRSDTPGAARRLSSTYAGDSPKDASRTATTRTWARRRSSRSSPGSSSCPRASAPALAPHSRASISKGGKSAAHNR